MNYLRTIANVARTGTHFVVKNKKAVGAGWTMMTIWISGVGAVLVTPKALAHIEQLKEKLGKEKLSPMDILRATWKDYAIPVAIAASGTATGVMSLYEYEKTIGVISGVADTAMTALAVQKDIMKDIVGEETANQIQNATTASLATPKNPTQIESGLNVVQTSYGSQLYRDSATGFYIRSSEVGIQTAVNKANQLINERHPATSAYYCGGESTPRISVTVNEWINLVTETTDVYTNDIGMDMGWDNTGGFVSVEFNETGIAPTGEAYIWITHTNPAHLGYTY